MRVGEAEGDPEGDGRRTLANGWESRLWRLEDKHLREGSSFRQFGRPRPSRIRHRRRIQFLQNYKGTRSSKVCKTKDKKKKMLTLIKPGIVVYK